MTEKQRAYIEFIQEWSGVPFYEGDNVSKYINENKDAAYDAWNLECEIRGADNENAGDRD